MNISPAFPRLHLHVVEIIRDLPRLRLQRLFVLPLTYEVSYHRNIYSVLGSQGYMDTVTFFGRINE